MSTERIACVSRASGSYVGSITENNMLHSKPGNIRRPASACQPR
jgi:hypothetical protein